MYYKIIKYLYRFIMVIVLDLRWRGFKFINFYLTVAYDVFQVCTIQLSSDEILNFSIQTVLKIFGDEACSVSLLL